MEPKQTTIEYVIEVRAKDGTLYTTEKRSKDPKIMGVFLEGCGFRNSLLSDPRPMEYRIRYVWPEINPAHIERERAKSQQPREYIRVKCTNKQCQAGFIPREGKFEMCPTCKGDATILKEKEKV